MKRSTTLTVLTITVLLLALVSSAAGLFTSGSSQSYTFTSLRGQEVTILGQGIYRNDALFTAATFIGTDAIMLFLCIPVTIAALALYRRGSLRGGLVLVGMLGFFMYNAASLSFGSSLNELFLVYIAGFSASLYAFILGMMQVDVNELAKHVKPGMPNRGIAWFLMICGVVVALVWLSDLVGAMLSGKAPTTLMSYTTIITDVIDIGLIAPTCVVAGTRLLKKDAWGYLLSVPLLVAVSLIGLVVVGQTVTQLSLGVELSLAEILIFCVSFITLSAIGIVFTARFFRNLSEKPL